jgi:hypothetical protein
MEEDLKQDGKIKRDYNSYCKFWRSHDLNFSNFCRVVDVVYCLHTYPPVKMEQIQCSKMSAYNIQTPGNYPEDNILHLIISFAIQNIALVKFTGRHSQFTYQICCWHSNYSSSMTWKVNVISWCFRGTTATTTFTEDGRHGCSQRQ